MYITKTDISNGPQLGSQMSQYAGLYRTAKKLGFKIVFFLECMNIGRKVKLFDVFNIEDEIINYKNDYKIFRLRDIIYDENILKLDTNYNWDIKGWFHLYHYWDNIRNDIIKVFNFKKFIVDESIEKLNTIVPSKNLPIVSLHVRRGDYLECASLVLNLDYYNIAINTMKEKIGDFNIIVFSDDINWCKDNIKGHNIYYSENNYNYIDMCMMTLCEHNIIANSSFSWWGAYLNQSTDKIVICPENYIGEGDKDYQFINKNYYPNTWIPLKIHK